MEGEEVNTELDKYWKAVRDNPGDFTGWTYLLQYVEQEVSVVFIDCWISNSCVKKGSKHFMVNVLEETGSSQESI